MTNFVGGFQSTSQTKIHNPKYYIGENEHHSFTIWKLDNLPVLCS